MRFAATGLALAFCLAAALTVLPPGVAQGSVVKVGAPGPLQLGVAQGILYGLQLAAGEINARGGSLGRKLTVIPEDEAETPEVGIAAIRKLLEQDKVDLLIGGQTSGVTLAQLPHFAPR